MPAQHCLSSLLLIRCLYLQAGCSARQLNRSSSRQPGATQVHMLQARQAQQDAVHVSSTDCARGAERGKDGQPAQASCSHQCRRKVAQLQTVEVSSSQSALQQHTHAQRTAGGWHALHPESIGLGTKRQHAWERAHKKPWSLLGPPARLSTLPATGILQWCSLASLPSK